MIGDSGTITSSEHWTLGTEEFGNIEPWKYRTQGTRAFGNGGLWEYSGNIQLLEHKFESI